MEQMQVKVKTLSPVILSEFGDARVMTSTLDYIGGTVLRGALAGRYIEAQSLGHEAHRDAQFVQLFNEKLQFVTAYPALVDERGCRPTMVLPRSLLGIKSGLTPEQGAMPVQDRLADTTSRVNYKSVSGLAVVDGEELYRVPVRKSICLHMSRSSDEERLRGSSQDGGIFNYESIDAGQVFVGSIVGEAGDLEALRTALNLTEDSSLICHLGRSRYTQYGRCELTMGAVEPIADWPQPEGDELCLRLATPLIASKVQAGNAVEILRSLFAPFGAEIVEAYAAAQGIDSFVGVWHMKRPHETALAAGTVVRLRGEWTPARLTELQEQCYRGLGCRTAEGYGQVRLWQPREGGYAWGETAPQTLAVQSIPGPVREKVCAILAQRQLSQMQQWAVEDARASAKELKGKAHFFSELLGFLDQAAVGGFSRNEFRDTVKKSPQYADGRPFKKHLNSIHVKYTDKLALRRALFEEWDAFWQARPQKDEPLWDNKSLQGLLQRLDIAPRMLASTDACYEAYWQQFFRSARKAAAGEIKEAVEHE